MSAFSEMGLSQIQVAFLVLGSFALVVWASRQTAHVVDKAQATSIVFGNEFLAHSGLVYLVDTCRLV